MARGEVERTVTQSNNPSPSLCLAVLAHEALAEDLQPGAHCQDDGTVVHGPVHDPAGVQLGGRQALGEVLAAADHVELTARRYRRRRTGP